LDETVSEAQSLEQPDVYSEHESENEGLLNDITEDFAINEGASVIPETNQAETIQKEQAEIAEAREDVYEAFEPETIESSPKFI
jgi:hypothetical protein